MNFSTLQGMKIPEGNVTQIAKDGVILWKLETNKPIILEVEKITSDTYAGETTYTAEQFILLDIYPKTNGTVNITYGGLTKTITDTSGATEPNAQQVFFGAFNGVSDSVTTPTSGTLTIEGDCVAFACGGYQADSKNLVPPYYNGITGVTSMGAVQYIPDYAFNGGGTKPCILTSVNIPDSVVKIGKSAFYDCSLSEVTIPDSVAYIGHVAFCYMNVPTLKTVRVLSTTPAEIGGYTNEDGTTTYLIFGDETLDNFPLEQIIVPKGCGNAYKSATGWSRYASYIVEAS